MGLPIDKIREVLSSSAAVQHDRDQVIKTALFVSANAPQSLIDCIREAFIPQFSGGLIHVERYGEGYETTIHTKTDLAFIISGIDGETFSLYHELKAAGISTCVVGRSEQAVLDCAMRADAVIPVSDVVAFNDDKQLLKELAAWVLHTLPDELQLAYAANFSFVRRLKAQQIVNDVAKQNALVGGITIIPGADFPIMTANQAKMLLQLAALYGERIGPERARELIIAVGGGFALRALARQVVGVVPGFGWAVKAGIGYSGTLAMGRSAIELFEKNTDLSGMLDTLLAQRDKLIKSASTTREGASQKAGETYHKARQSAAQKINAVAEGAQNISQAVSKRAYDLLETNRHKRSERRMHRHEG